MLKLISFQGCEDQGTKRQPLLGRKPNRPVEEEVFLLDELGWERLEYVRLKQLAVTKHKINNDLSPSYLRRFFTNTSNAHSEFFIKNSKTVYQGVTVTRLFFFN